jgi:hypothetical protein
MGGLPTGRAAYSRLLPPSIPQLPYAVWACEQSVVVVLILDSTQSKDKKTGNEFELYVGILYGGPSTTGAPGKFHDQAGSVKRCYYYVINI